MMDHQTGFLSPGWVQGRLQVVSHLLDVLVTVDRVLGGRPDHHVLQRLGNVGVDGPHRWDVLPEVFDGNRDGVFPLEWHLPGQQFVEDDPQ